MLLFSKALKGPSILEYYSSCIGSSIGSLALLIAFNNNICIHIKANGVKHRCFIFSSPKVNVRLKKKKENKKDTVCYCLLSNVHSIAFNPSSSIFYPLSHVFILWSTTREKIK